MQKKFIFCIFFAFFELMTGFVKFGIVILQRNLQPILQRRKNMRAMCIFCCTSRPPVSLPLDTRPPRKYVRAMQPILQVARNYLQKKRSHLLKYYSTHSSVSKLPLSGGIIFQIDIYLFYK